MRKILTLLCLLSFLKNYSQSPCSILGFEHSSPGSYTATNAIPGWTVQSSTATLCTGTSVWSGGSNQFSLVSTPIYNYPLLGALPHSPLGGTLVARLGNDVSDGSAVRIRHTIQVTNSLTLLDFAYATYNNASGHTCCQQPQVSLKLYDCSGQPLTCYGFTLTTGTSCGTGTYAATTNTIGWKTGQIDLSPFTGTCVILEVASADCYNGSHYGVTYFDFKCGGDNLDCIMCYPGYLSSEQCGSNTSLLTAPPGYHSYQWISPLTGTFVPGPAGTSAALTVTNPIPGAIYTVQLSTAAGCQYWGTVAIIYSAVIVQGIGASPSCSNGTGGSATVVAGGSTGGYGYVWKDQSQNVVGTTSVINGLAPGIYSVQVSVPGYPNCLYAISTVTVGVQSPSPKFLNQPYCGSQAVLSRPGGNSYQWYDGTTAIAASAGGTAQTLYINNPQPYSIYWLSYNAYGCKDSVQFVLLPATGGSVSLVSNSTICAGSSNGMSTFSISPTVGTPPGWGSYTLVTGSTQVTTALVPGSIFSVPNLSSGVLYTVNVYDGACIYSQTISPVVAPTFSFGISVATTPTFCPGDSLLVAVQTGSQAASAYNYLWGPSLFLSDTTLSTALISPTVPVNSTGTFTYSITLTPTLAYCPVTHTFAIVAWNYSPPTIQGVAPFCEGNTNITLTASPSGGYFNGPSFVTPSGQLTQPSPGVFTYSYTISSGSCIATSISILTINAEPQFTVSFPQLICKGETHKLSATGQPGNTYTWSTGDVGNTIMVSPQNNAVIIITAGNQAGCTMTATTVLTVNDCLALENPGGVSPPVKFFPNPAKDRLNYECATTATLEIIDPHGRIVARHELRKGGSDIDISSLSPASYQLRITSAGKQWYSRVVKTQ
jgi:hypothetical protein